MPDQVGLGLADEIRGYLEGLETTQAGRNADWWPVDRRISRNTVAKMLKLVKDAAGVTEYLLPPLPNTIFARDTSCWSYAGVTPNSLFWPAQLATF